MIKPKSFLLLASFLFSACGSPTAKPQQIESIPEPVGNSSVPEMAPTQWKERLQVFYVYLDCRGDYRELGASMTSLLSLAKDSGAKPVGPLFALFYDDPGSTPIAELRSRLCIPVADVPPRGSLGYDVLPRAKVVYSTVRGPYPNLPKIYPTLLAYMKQKNWQAAGPIREIYFTAPGSVKTYDELVGEVQIPWEPGG